MVVENIEVQVIRKNIKRMRLTISPKTSEPKVSAPHRISDKEIYDFLFAHIEWIKKNQEKVNERIKIKQSKRTLASGKPLFLWGDEYTLKIITGASRATVSFDDEYIYLKVPTGANKEKLSTTLDRLYKRELEDFIEEILPHWIAVTKEEPVQIKYRTMKSKWGTCNATAKVITLNSHLATLPSGCAEMVLVHEIVHFKERLHNARFKSFMTSYVPDWKERTKILRTGE